MVPGCRLSKVVATHPTLSIILVPLHRETPTVELIVVIVYWVCVPVPETQRIYLRTKRWKKVPSTWRFEQEGRWSCRDLRQVRRREDLLAAEPLVLPCWVVWSGLRPGETEKQSREKVSWSAGLACGSLVVVWLGDFRSHMQGTGTLLVTCRILVPRDRTKVNKNAFHDIIVTRKNRSKTLL